MESTSYLTMRLFTPRHLGPISPYSGTDTGGAPSPQSERTPSTPAPQAAPVWNGEERRIGEDRRCNARRQEQQGTLLDTRCGSDRRQRGRRIGDADPWTTLKV
ncbi:hypothetical protein [Chitinolyticbacter meiyuanensis]|uniref:hypothetical protein n=1 Tax=Chitinolyticbacter meiyuanensis TaxID=682798 RepID=UPI0011E5AD29|nr:hypothetical protein [Chitinolyticbacter meiyuanensis]